MSSQSTFSAALLDPGGAVPAPLRQPGGALADKRFGVYRNNVIVSLIDAMATGFPAVQALLGEDYFRALAAEFVRANPPTSPILAHYGEAFPLFVAEFPPLAKYVYMPDVARLELSRRDSCNAADMQPRAAEQLAVIDQNLLMSVVPQPHPSLRLLRSDWPIDDIWHANSDALNTRQADIQLGPQCVMLMRPALEVQQYVLSEDAYLFATATDGVQSLAAIAARVLEQYPQSDFIQQMVLMIQRGAIAEFTLPKEAST